MTGMKSKIRILTGATCKDAGATHGSAHELDRPWNQHTLAHLQYAISKTDTRTIIY